MLHKCRPVLDLVDLSLSTTIALEQAAQTYFAVDAELGLTALAVPEAQGGMGFGPMEAMVVLEELGRGLVSAPYAQGALIAPALLQEAPDLGAAIADVDREGRITADSVITTSPRTSFIT